MTAPSPTYDLRTPIITPFTDDINQELIHSVRDALSAAWNAWETSIKFEDDEKAQYYMQLIKLYASIEIQIQKVKKQ